MIPQQTSNHDAEHNPKLQFIEQMYRLRKENDRLRKQISNNLHLIFSTLKETSNQDQILKNQNQITHCLSQDYTEKLLAALNFCYQQTQFMISESGQASKEVNQSIDEKKKKLQQIKTQIMSKENSIHQISQLIQNKRTSIDSLEQELQTLINQHMQCRIKYIQKEHSQKSYDEKINQNHLVQQWEKQKRYIITLIQQRAQIRKKLLIVQKAHELFNKKINDEQKNLQFYLQKKQRNDFLSQQNANLLYTLNSQKERKQYLEDTKMIQVLKKQVSLSADIVQKWDEEKRIAENNLLSIIQKINTKLPFRKLQDLTQIFSAAQRHYNLPKDAQIIYQEQEKQRVENQEELNMN